MNKESESWYNLGIAIGEEIGFLQLEIDELRESIARPMPMLPATEATPVTLIKVVSKKLQNGRLSAKLTQQRDMEILMLREGGHTVEQVRDAYGVGYATVVRATRRAKDAARQTATG